MGLPAADFASSCELFLDPNSCIRLSVGVLAVASCGTPLGNVLNPPLFVTMLMLHTTNVAARDANAC